MVLFTVSPTGCRRIGVAAAASDHAPPPTTTTDDDDDATTDGSTRLLWVSNQRFAATALSWSIFEWAHDEANISTTVFLIQLLPTPSAIWISVNVKLFFLRIWFVGIFCIRI